MSHCWPSKLPSSSLGCWGFAVLGFRVFTNGHAQQMGAIGFRVEIPLLFFLSISLVMMKVWEFYWRPCSSFGLYLKNKGGGINQINPFKSKLYQVFFLRFLFFLLARFIGKSSDLTNINGIFQLGCVHQQPACMFFWGWVAATRDLRDLLGRMFFCKAKTHQFWRIDTTGPESEKSLRRWWV